MVKGGPQNEFPFLPFSYSRSNTKKRCIFIVSLSADSFFFTLVSLWQGLGAVYSRFYARFFLPLTAQITVVHYRRECVQG